MVNGFLFIAIVFLLLFQVSHKFNQKPICFCTGTLIRSINLSSPAGKINRIGVKEGVKVLRRLKRGNKVFEDQKQIYHHWD